LVKGGSLARNGEKVLVHKTKRYRKMQVDRRYSMKSNKIKKIGVLLVFSIFVSLISFNMAWAESKTFYFVLNDQDDWTYTLGDPPSGSFTVNVSDNVTAFEKFNATIDGISFGNTYTDASMNFRNGVPSTSSYDFELRTRITRQYQLELYQKQGGRKSGNHWALYMHGGNDIDGEDIWDKIESESGNWFFIPNEYVEWSGAPRTPKIPRYDTPILTNVNDMVDFKPLSGPYLTIPFTEDYPPCKCGCPDTSVAFFGFGAGLHNKSCTSLTNLTVKVRTLTNENLLLLARGGEAYPENYAGAETGGEGGLWTLPLPPSGSYSDGTLGPAEYTIVVFAICLEEGVPFRFYVDLLGEMQ
jgi:hypothetical protein